jgi:hypothetical protein
MIEALGYGALTVGLGVVATTLWYWASCDPVEW